MKGHSKLSSKEWNRLTRALQHFKILVVQCVSDRSIAGGVSVVGEVVNNARAIRIRNRPDTSQVTKLIFLDSKGSFSMDQENLVSGTPKAHTAFDIIHEASHLILNDFRSKEERGISQFDLLLAMYVSQDFFGYVELLHKEFYDDYEKTKNSEIWKIGTERALTMFGSRFQGYMNLGRTLLNKKAVLKKEGDIYL